MSAELPSKQRTSLYERGGRIFVRTCCQLQTGVWSERGACSVLPGDADTGVIGSCAFEHLRASVTGLPHPVHQAEWKEFSQPLFEAAGVRSWNAFARSARHVGLGARDGTISVEAHEKRGSAFYVIDGAQIRVPEEAGPTALGEAIRDAIIGSK